jgi:hypothetical protein
VYGIKVKPNHGLLMKQNRLTRFIISWKSEKIGEKIKNNIIPKIYDHNVYKTGMISAVEYEK